MTTTTLPSFAHISISEIAELIKADAPASVLAVWSILASFDYKKRGTCFPKISTIKKLLESTGGSFREGKIYWALSWMEEKGFLKRNTRRSRQRFEMKLRQESFRQTYDPSELKQAEPTTDESRRENLRKRELTLPLTPSHSERGKPRKSSRSLKRERARQLEEKLQHERSLSNYCEEVAGYLLVRDNVDFKHLNNPVPSPAHTFSSEELRLEVQNKGSLNYQHVGRQKIWDWLKSKHF